MVAKNYIRLKEEDFLNPFLPPHFRCMMTYRRSCTDFTLEFPYISQTIILSWRSMTSKRESLTSEELPKKEDAFLNYSLFSKIFMC